MDKETRVFNIFQTVADRYDSANERISLGQQQRWKRAAVQSVVTAIPRNGRVLDLCCGTGDITSLLLKSAPGLSVVGLDFSPRMLDEAMRKVGGDKRVALLEGNAAALPFENETFDAAIISFGLRNTCNFGRVIGEMSRTVRPGGVVCCIDSFMPRHRWIKPFYSFYFRYVMPFIGGGISYHGEYRWLNESTETFLTPDELESIMRVCGLIEILGKSFLFGACAYRTGYRGGT